MQQEILLTKDEIISIESFVSKNPALRMENIINFGSDFKTVYNISPKNGLIFIKGNIHTGFEHIHTRHEFWSEILHKTNTKEEKLDNPSKFRKDSIPIFDYIKISDAIYGQNNLATKKNKRPELFDYYIGEYIHNDNKKEVYILLTYKDSKVVHSLFPKTKKNNPKRPKHFKYKRGEIFSQHNLKTDIVEISIPYLNSRNITAYTILFKRHNQTNIEEIIIRHHDEKGDHIGHVFLGQRDLVKIEDISKLLFRLKYVDLTNLEKHIMEIEKQITAANNKYTAFGR